MPYKDAAARREAYQRNKERYQARNKRWYANLRLGVLKHYSPNLVCQECGFSDVRALTIDHVDGGGDAHRRELAKSLRRMPGPWALYRWLRDNGYPTGYRVLCMNCQFITHFHRTAEAGHSYYGLLKLPNTCEEAECSHYQQEMEVESYGWGENEEPL
jgi:hypothetical protein